ncbi:MAG TPA: hypothetical protein ENN22_09700 [bacterium]|nr:hypothetical protein [bacterium]
MLKSITIGILLLNSVVLYSQQLDVNFLRQKEQQLSVRIEALQIEKTKFIHQSDSLAVSIQQLKSNQSLNLFQRRRLEKLLKSSQELNQNINQVNQKMKQFNRELQSLLRELVSWYDKQIAEIISSAKGNKLTQTELQQLSAWNAERSQYLKKIRQNQFQLQLSKPIEIEESDSYQIVKQKADFLQDQADKARKQIKLVHKRVNELQKELKLRNRMNELIADTYLMDQPIEKFLPQSQLKGANYNAELSKTDKARAQSSSSFDVVDNMLLKTDVSGISNIDLESYIRNLQQMKIKLTQSADSLGTVADQFYQAAEKKRQDENKN